MYVITTLMSTFSTEHRHNIFLQNVSAYNATIYHNLKDRTVGIHPRHNLKINLKIIFFKQWLILKLL